MLFEVAGFWWSNNQHQDLFCLAINVNDSVSLNFISRSRSVLFSTCLMSLSSQTSWTFAQMYLWICYLHECTGLHISTCTIVCQSSKPSKCCIWLFHEEIKTFKIKNFVKFWSYKVLILSYLERKRGFSFYILYFYTIDRQVFWLF